MSLAKFSMGALDHSFLEFLEHPVKLKIFHVLATVAKSNVEAKWQMRRIKFSLIKMIQRHQEVLIIYNKSVEEVMQAIGS